jgi:hypothetical protein
VGLDVAAIDLRTRARRVVAILTSWTAHEAWSRPIVATAETLCRAHTSVRRLIVVVIVAEISAEASVFFLFIESAWPAAILSDRNVHYPGGTFTACLFKLRGIKKDGISKLPNIVATERHMLRDIKPEVEIVHGSLLITHIDVEREEIDWR